jgi:hypothetical protein
MLEKYNVLIYPFNTKPLAGDIMKKILISLISAILFLGMMGVADAGLINGGFETGDLTGWTRTFSPYYPEFGPLPASDYWSRVGMDNSYTPIE